MSESEKNALIAQFSGVTGVDTERARFYLESAAWNLDLAMGSFFDTGDDVDPPEEVLPSAGLPEASDGPAPAPPKSQPKPQSRFGTISNMRSDDDTDDEEKEAYYAGGSEHGGGQQILDPRRKKKNTDQLVQDMFKAAKDHGAEEVGGDEAAPSRSTRGVTFRGTGYRLGETEEPSVVVPGFPAEKKRSQVDMVLKLWKEGFSVDSGPLRGYNDPENQEFLASIKKGEIPKELIKEARGTEVNLQMEDHRDEEYVKPRATIAAFSGSGHRLGSPASSIAETTPVPSPPAAASGSIPTVNSPADESKPSTNIQIRLSDGSRLVTKFNLTHTVADVRSYINLSRPPSAGLSYVLMTTFPNKELTDETQTLEEAKLQNAVLVQRVK